mgnify:CR=1 FL=1
MEKQREKYLKKARKVQIYNIIYDTGEVIVSLIAGFTSGSAALIGWGLDSVIEVVSASTLWWRLHGEIKEIKEQQVRKREKITFFVIATSFLLVSLFITYDSISKLLAQKIPSWSTTGVIILVISLVVFSFGINIDMAKSWIVKSLLQIPRILLYAFIKPLRF